VLDKLRDLANRYRRCLVVLASQGTLSTVTLMQAGAGGQAVGVTLKVCHTRIL
jgi:hypothetical protein